MLANMWPEVCRMRNIRDDVRAWRLLAGCSQSCENFSIIPFQTERANSAPEGLIVLHAGTTVSLLSSCVSYLVRGALHPGSRGADLTSFGKSDQDLSRDFAFSPTRAPLYCQATPNAVTSGRLQLCADKKGRASAGMSLPPHTRR